eukprot:1917209-Prymnesium_polylepis.1
MASHGVTRGHTGSHGVTCCELDKGCGVIRWGGQSVTQGGGRETEGAAEVSRKGPWTRRWKGRWA